MQLNTTLGKALSLELLLVMGNVIVKIEAKSTFNRNGNVFIVTIDVRMHTHGDLLK
ncbi:hypothetical protein FORC73_3558 [Vibrio cholerae]|nr:hypothetical protein FORC73_3558 [Vibrio cholerae]